MNNVLNNLPSAVGQKLSDIFGTTPPNCGSTNNCLKLFADIPPIEPGSPPQITRFILPLLGATALAFLAYWIYEAILEKIGKARIGKSLSDFSTVAVKTPDARLGSTEYIIREVFAGYGMDVAGKEQTSLNTARIIIGLIAVAALMSAGAGVLLSLGAGGALGFFITNAVVSSKAEKIRLEIDKEVPTLLRNLSGIIQAEPNVAQAVTSTQAALDPQKPLYTWLTYLTTTIQAQGLRAFEFLVPEANEISTALGVAVFEIARMAESGGQGYTRAFKLAADNLAETLIVKAQAHSKASGATGLAKLIIATAVVSLAYILLSPVGQDIYINDPIVKTAVIAALPWGVYGWVFIKDMVREATE